MHFSKRSDWPLADNALSQKNSEKKSKKIRVLDLSESNPTRCGFHYSKKILSALAGFKNLTYTPETQGLLQARRAVAAYYASKKIKVHPSWIFLTSSSSEAYSFLFRLLCDPEDSILAPRPSYPLLEYLTSINDVELRPYSLRWDGERWQTDWTSVDSCLEGAKALVVVNPNNPTGHYLSIEDKDRLNRCCQEKGVALIVDEVFLDYPVHLAHAKPLSFASNQDALTFTVSGVSKVLALPQMKLSWIVISGPESEAQRARERLALIADTYLSVNTPSQNALGLWFSAKSSVQKEIRQRLYDNFTYLKKAFSNHPKARVLNCEGGWYAVVQCLAEQAEDEALAIRLLEEEETLVHPGYFFDFESSKFLVLSLLLPTTPFKKGVEKLSRVLHGFS